MIILITGATHTGKTALARRMIARYGYPCLSLDHLKMGLIRAGYTDLTPYDDDALTAYLWPVAREMIKTAVENGQDMMIEGCYIPFDWRSGFEERYLPSIRYVCLAMTDGYIDAHYGDILAHASDAEARPDDSGLSPGLLKRDNRAYISGCAAAGERVTLIDGDYERAIEKLLE